MNEDDPETLKQSIVIQQLRPESHAPFCDPDGTLTVARVVHNTNRDRLGPFQI